MLVVNGEVKALDSSEIDALLALLLPELPLKTAVKIVQNYLSSSKNEGYTRALNMTKWFV